MIKSNLNPVSGNATWTIPNTVPYATYSLRAFVYRNVTQANGMNISQPLATGVSVGYFQVRALGGLGQPSMLTYAVRPSPSATLSTFAAAAVAHAVYTTVVMIMTFQVVRPACFDADLGFKISRMLLAPASRSDAWGQHLPSPACMPLICSRV